jgi:hypothetical protein
LLLNISVSILTQRTPSSQLDRHQDPSWLDHTG